MLRNEIIIYTDGSSRGNPGPAGWGSVLLFPDGKVIELGGREKESTNNRMEISAAIFGLKEVEKTMLHQNADEEKRTKAKTLKIYTDSSYLLNGITMWIYGWAKNNWLTKTKEPVLNRDLWETLYKVESNLKHKYEINWEKVSGHAGVHLNERCDAIATSFAGNNTTILFRGNLKDYQKLFGKINSDEITSSQPSPLVRGRARVGVSSSRKKEAYAYVSQVAGKIHSDKTWAQCEKRVKGKSGAKYQKVFSREEEQNLIALWSLKSLF
jgi:ribonuclease HI